MIYEMDSGLFKCPKGHLCICIYDSIFLIPKMKNIRSILHSFIFFLSFLCFQAWNTTISLAICKVGSYLCNSITLKLLFPLFSCLSCNVQALDLLEMLKKEEEMLSAVKDRQSKVVNTCCDTS